MYIFQISIFTDYYGPLQDLLESIILFDKQLWKQNKKTCLIQDNKRYTCITVFGTIGPLEMISRYIECGMQTWIVIIFNHDIVSYKCILHKAIQVIVCLCQHSFQFLFPHTQFPIPTTLSTQSNPKTVSLSIQADIIAVSRAGL